MFIIILSEIVGSEIIKEPSQMAENYPKIYLYKRIVQAKLFIDIHFAEKINLNDIADEAYFSKFHFTRLFKKVYGKTPHQYLTWVRMFKAGELLQTGQQVTVVCSLVGFESLSSFIGLFKRYHRKAPSVYQQEYMARHKLMEDKPLHFIPNCFAEQKGWIKNSNFEEVG